MQRRRFTRLSPAPCYHIYKMNIRHAFLIALCLACPALAAEPPQEIAHDYVRYIGDDQRGKLETVIVTMRNKAGVTVELIGAVHIADAAYYKALNELFTTYDELLFELVDGQKLKAGAENAPKPAKKAAKPATKKTAPIQTTPAADEDSDTTDEVEEKTNPAFGILRTMMQGFGTYFRLQYQTDATEGINYKAKNFVHADVSMAEFEQLQSEHGESFATIFQKALESEMNKAGKKSENEPKGGQLLLALLGDSSGIKIAMAKMLGKVETIGEEVGFGAGSVIVGERNRVALEIFDRQVKTGRKKFGIFYGAAHLDDMEKRLETRGYKRTAERWFTAWDIKPRVDELKK